MEFCATDLRFFDDFIDLNPPVPQFAPCHSHAVDMPGNAPGLNPGRAGGRLTSFLQDTILLWLTGCLAMLEKQTVINAERIDHERETPSIRDPGPARGTDP